MMVQALLLLPRLVVTPPARLVVVPPHRAAVRRFTAPDALSEDCGMPARGAEQLLGTMSTAPGRGKSVQMCSATRHSDREDVLAAVRRKGYELEYASAELRADREVVLAAVQREGGSALQHASPELKLDPKVVLAVRC